MPLLLWLLAAKKKKLLHLLQHQLPLQHLPQLLTPLSLLLLAPLPLLPALPLSLWTPPKTQLLPLVQLVLPLAQLLVLLSKPPRSNFFVFRKKAASGRLFSWAFIFQACLRCRPSEVKPGGTGVGARHDDVFCAATQGLRHQGLNQRGPVVLYAQVRRYQMLQPPVGDCTRDIRRRGI